MKLTEIDEIRDRIVMCSLVVLEHRTIYENQKKPVQERALAQARMQGAMREWREAVVKLRDGLAEGEPES